MHLIFYEKKIIVKFRYLKHVSSLGSELRSFFDIQYKRLCIVKYKETSQHYY